MTSRAQEAHKPGILIYYNNQIYILSIILHTTLYNQHHQYVSDIHYTTVVTMLMTSLVKRLKFQSTLMWLLLYMWSIYQTAILPHITVLFSLIQGTSNSLSVRLCDSAR